MTTLRARLLAAALALAVGGCAIGRDSEPPPATPEANAVAAVVAELAAAARAGDWPEICDRLFTPAARARAGGANCARFVAATASGLRDPQIRIESIAIRGALATAVVRSRAAGEPPVRDIIVFRRLADGWRIEGLR